tara:strand:+ start:123 stop:365 length:243 start_codon:yes stop_codon:yes gene_type:complete
LGAWEDDQPAPFDPLHMESKPQRTPPITDWLLRGLRIGASTIAIVELLRSDWLGGGLASLAWLIFVQVERRRASVDQSDT